MTPQCSNDAGLVIAYGLPKALEINANLVMMQHRQVRERERATRMIGDLAYCSRMAKSTE